MNATNQPSEEPLSHLFNLMRTPKAHAPGFYPSPEGAENPAFRYPTPAPSSCNYSPWLSTTPRDSWTPPTPTSVIMDAHGSPEIPAVMDTLGSPQNSNVTSAPGMQVYQAGVESGLVQPQFATDWHLFQQPVHGNMSTRRDSVHVKLEYEPEEYDLNDLPAPYSQQLPQMSHPGPFHHETHYLPLEPTTDASYGTYSRTLGYSSTSEHCHLPVTPGRDQSQPNQEPLYDVARRAADVKPIKIEPDRTQSEQSESMYPLSESEQFEIYINVEGNERNDNPWAKERKIQEYMCSICRKFFVRRSNFIAHLETHDRNRPRPYKCSFENCTQTFPRAAERNRHIGSVHLKNKKFACECGDTFPRSDSLKRHQNTGCRLKRLSERQRDRGVTKKQRSRMSAQVPANDPLPPDNTSTSPNRGNWQGRSSHDSRVVQSLISPTNISINPLLLDRQLVPREMRYITRSLGYVGDPQEPASLAPIQENQPCVQAWDYGALHIS